MYEPSPLTTHAEKWPPWETISQTSHWAPAIRSSFPVWVTFVSGGAARSLYDSKLFSVSMTMYARPSASRLISRSAMDRFAVTKVRDRHVWSPLTNTAAVMGPFAVNVFTVMSISPSNVLPSGPYAGGGGVGGGAALTTGIVGKIWLTEGAGA